MNLIKAALTAIIPKSLRTMRLLNGWPIPSGTYNAKLAYNNTVVEACIRYLAASILKCDLRLIHTPSGTILDNHPILDVLRQPYEGVSYRVWTHKIVESWVIDGIVSLLPIDLSGEYTDMNPAGIYPVDVEVLQSLTAYQTQLIHVMFQLRRGLPNTPESPLHSAGRLLQLDDALVNSTYGRLKSPTAGLVVKTKARDHAVTNAEQSKLKSLFDRVRNTSAGEAVFLDDDVDVMELRGQHQRVDYTPYSNLVEERICSLLGISPARIQLGVGLQSTRVGATLIEESRSTWEDAAIPMIEHFEELLNLYILPLYSNYDQLSLKLSHEDVFFQSSSERLADIQGYREMIDSGICTVEYAALQLGVPAEYIATATLDAASPRLASSMVNSDV